MRYTLHLFALKASEFAKRLGDAETAVSQVKRWLKRSDIGQADRASGLRWVKEICLGNLPEDAPADYFSAMTWIGDAMLERIDFPSLAGIKSISVLDSSHIWSVLDKTVPPFSVPKSSVFPPGVGFLTSADMPRAIRVLGEMNDRPDHTSRPELTMEVRVAGVEEVFSTRTTDEDRAYGRYASEEFCGILESLCDDNLDLLAVMSGPE